MREEWGGLKAGAGSGSSPVTRAGYQRPSCCLARHAEPACRELRSGSWKGRSSATGTTCPWENLRSGQGGAQSRSARASKPRATRAWASLREGVLGRHTQTCTRTHTRTTCVQVQMCTHPRTQTCAPVYTWPHALADALAHGKDGAAPRTRCLVPLASFLGGRDEVPAGAREDGSPPPLPLAGPQLRRVFGAGALCADGPEPLEQPGAPAVTVVSELAE